MSRLWAAVLSFVVFVPVLVTGPAAEAVGGSISGSVAQDVTTFALADVDVHVYDANESLVASVQTDGFGWYTVADLADGEYRVQFLHGGHVAEWHANQVDFASADPIVVSGGSAETADVALAISNSIAGTVIADATGDPVADVMVIVFDSMYMQIGETSTNALGQYVMNVYSGQDYRLQFLSTTHANEWYEDVSDFAFGHVLVVPEGGQVVANASLADGAVISGVVTDSDTGLAIPAVSIEVYDTSQVSAGTGLTDDAGVFTVGGLSAGSYRVRFSSQSHVDEWLDDASSFEAAQEISVESGSDTPIAGSLSPGGTISGAVTSVATGDPVQWMSVEILDASSWMQVGWGSTDEFGQYSVGGLEDGSYKVRFDGMYGQLSGEWFNDALTYETATVIDVVGSSDHVANAQLASPGSVSGVVTDSASGLGIPNVNVEVRDANNNWGGSSSTDEAGLFVVGGLAAGSYRVWLSSQSHIDEWFDVASSLESAQEVLVESGVDTPIAVSLSTGGEISGTVTSAATGDPVVWSWVELYHATSWEQLRGTSTDESGNYSIGGLEDGSYKVRFQGDWSQYSEEWFDDASSHETATTIDVIDGSVHVADAQLTSPGSISGTVTDESTLAGIASVNVEVYDINNMWMGSASTDGNGGFVVQPLVSGSYRVRLTSQTHLDEWYDDAASFSTAQDVVVVSGADTPIVAALSTGSTISGTVTTDEATPVAVPWMSVQIYEASSWMTVGWAQTDESGHFEVGGLPDGSYKVHFDGVWGQYSEEWFDNASSYETATQITVSGGSAHVADAQLAPFGSVSGTLVEEGTTDGVADATVEVYDTNYTWAGSTSTDANGSFLVEGLKAGSYRVRFVSNSHMDEWFDDQGDFYTATDVIVSSGVDTPIAASLSTGGSIFGTVTSEATGVPVQGMQVVVYDHFSWTHIGSATTNELGEYAIGGVPDGSFRVHYQGVWDQYADEWYDDAQSSEYAAPVAVSGGAPVELNAQLASLGSISGTVTDADTGDGIPNVQVEARVSEWDTSGWATTDADGNFAMTGLRAGAYKLWLSSQSHINEWFDGKANFNEADPVSVDAGADTPVAVVLSTGGSITGTVTSEATGDSVSGMYIEVVDAFSGENLGSASTDGLGKYALVGLADGSYKVHFHGVWGQSAGEWFNNALHFDSATAIAVTGGSSHVADAQLSAPGTIEVTVTEDGTGTPIPFADVSVVDSTQEGVAYGSTDGHGIARIENLSAGYYRVEVYHSSTHLPEWYQNVTSFDVATPVAVASGDTTQISVSLATGGTIEGTVVYEGSADPVPGVEVQLWPAECCAPWMFKGDVTDENGAFSFDVLAEGGYKLRFMGSTRYEVWYDGEGGSDTADIVSVLDGETTVVEGSIPRPGAVAGTVSEDGTDTPISGVEVIVWNGSYTWIGGDVTDENGEYEIPNVGAGEVRIQLLSPTHANEWYDDAGSFETAMSVTVEAGTTATVDIGLSQGATIRGTVTDEATGLPIEGVSVSTESVPYSSSAWDETDVNGEYELTGLAPADYQISFYDPVYVSEFHSDAATMETATLVPVVGEELLVIDAALSTGGTVAGVVSADGSGANLSEISVSLVSVDWPGVSYQDWTDSAGAYEIAAVRPGDYKVGFHPLTMGGPLPYVPEWHEDQRAEDFADSVTVTYGETTVVDAGLAVHGAINGTITDGSGDPVPFAQVQAHDAARQDVGSAWTDSSGSYTIDQLAPGSYALSAFVEGSPTVWYVSSLDFWSADLVTVDAGVATEGIDFAVADGGIITGTVRDYQGSGIANVYVGAYAPDRYSSVASVYTDENGDYTIAGLLAGDYRVRTSWYGYDDLWYSGAGAWSDADLVSVSAATPAVIDFAHPAPGSISGNVSDGASGISGVDVVAWGVRTYMQAASTSTGAGGEYSLVDLPPGDYVVSFSGAGYAAELWNDFPGPFYGAFGVLDLITVTSGVESVGIDAVLDAPGTITGTVTDVDTTDPIVEMQVEIYRVEGGASVSVTTDENGVYRAEDLFPGTYEVAFSGWGTPYLTTWYDSQSSQKDAAQIAVASGAIMTADAALATGGGITGTVTAGGSPVNGASIMVVSRATLLRWGTWFTNEAGEYEVVGIPDGEYDVQVTTVPDSLPYLPKPSGPGYLSYPLSASSVTVTSGAIVPAPEIQLDPAGSIAGRVLDELGQPIVNAQVEMRSFNNPDHVRWAYTDATGSYRFDQLSTTNYTIGAATTIGEMVYYDGVGDLADAVPVPVVGGSETSDIDVIVASPAMGSIEGAVTRDGGIPFVRAQVVAEDSSGSSWNVLSDYDGAYSLDVPAGTYTVSFYPAYVWAGDEPVYVYEWYESQFVAQTATDVVVAAGAATPGISADIGRGGTVSGTVTTAGGAPLGGVTVRLKGPLDEQLETITASDGTFSASRVRPGSHTVQFIHPDYVNEWSGDVLREGDATSITVSDGVETSSVDAELAEGGSITGTLSASFGMSYPVEVYLADGTLVAWSAHEGTGPYTINGVPEGTVHVKLHSWEEVSIGQWYGGDTSEWWAESSPTQGYGTPVPVTSGVTASGIDFAPVTPATISGSLTDAASGLPLGDVDACLMNSEASGTPYGQICAEVQYPDAQWSLFMGPGTYKLLFNDWNYGHVNQWWQGASDETDATLITVADGEALVGYDAALDRLAGISGTVIDDLGSPINAAVIDVFESSDTATPVATVYTNPVGEYLVGGLAAGDYVVRLSARDEAFDTRWYDRRSAAVSADAVAVSAGILASGTDFSLAAELRDETTVEVVPPGGTINSGDDDVVADEDDPIETEITLPSGSSATVEITEIPVDEVPPDMPSEELPDTGVYELVGSVIVIEADVVASASDPIEIKLTLDALLVEGLDIDSIIVFRYGVPVPNCDTNPEPPVPCVSSRTVLSGGESEGDFQFAILTDHTSPWSFATEIPPSIAIDALAVDPTVPVSATTEISLTARMTITSETDVTIEWGDGTTEMPEITDPALETYDFTHTYATYGDFTITVTLSEGDTTDSSSVGPVVVYEPIDVTSMTVAPAAPVRAGSNLVFATLDVIAAPGSDLTITWGDGAQETTTFAEAGRYEDVSFTYEYPSAGVYTVEATIWDGDTSKSEIYEFVVVYDATGAFVTGGGWLPSMEDHSQFGLVARYDKHGNPTGRFKAHLPQGKLTATALDWIVITIENTILIQGVGSLDGESGYLFRLDLTDGASSGSSDTYSLKVWQPGANPLTSSPFHISGDVAGGQISVHR